jgi:hypothetical protein
VKRSPLVLVLALACSSCVGKGDGAIELVFDPCATRVAAAAGSSASEVASIDRALALWNEAAELALERAEAPPSDPPREAVLEVSFVPTIAALRGVYDDEVGAIMVNRAIEGEEQRALTIAHELGHAFGLLHVPPGERASLMNPGDPQVTPTPEDVGALLDLWGRCTAE